MTTNVSKSKLLSMVKTGDKTISNIFLSANWMEERLRFYGVDFIGHPQLKRILNMDEMISFPMRKEFPLKMADEHKDDRFSVEQSTIAKNTIYNFHKCQNYYYHQSICKIIKRS
jgi:NADH:ubiquinone oxidoreductase subunit C